MQRPPRLDSRFFAVDPVTLARQLLGQRLVRVLEGGVRLAGTIVEAEAYVGIPDKGAHTYGGRRTPRNDRSTSGSTRRGRTSRARG